MAQANCLPSAMRALITGANQKSSTAQNFPGGRDFRWDDAVPGVIGAILAGRFLQSLIDGAKPAGIGFAARRSSSSQPRRLRRAGWRPVAWRGSILWKFFARNSIDLS